MKQNNAAVTYTEVNQIIGSSSYDGTKCVTKDILSNNWIVDSSKLTEYQSNQLVKYQDTSTPVELPTPSFSVPLTKARLSYAYDYDSFVGWYKKAKIFNSELTAAQVQLL